GKMGDVASQEGRTVFFVSHNMAAVTVLCNRSMLINQGRIQTSGSTSSVINTYLRDGNKFDPEKNGSGLGEFFELKHQPSQPKYDSEILITSDLYLNKDITDYKLFFILQDKDSNLIVHSVVNGSEFFKTLEAGKYSIEIKIPPTWLNPGHYSYHFKLVSAIGKRIRILSTVVPMEFKYFVDNENNQGILNPKIDWQVIRR
ncbi:MAG: hypothetical protein AAGU75_21965, partial [Bacillota bacterium]